MGDSVIDLDDYFFKNYDYFASFLKTCTLNYQLLREEDSIKLAEYQVSIKEILSSLNTSPPKSPLLDTSDEKILQNQSSMLKVSTNSLLRVKKTQNLKNNSKSELYYSILKINQKNSLIDSSQIIETKDPLKLKKASHILFEAIHTQSIDSTIAPHHTPTSSKYNSVEGFKKCAKYRDFLHCVSGQKKIILHNIGDDVIELTEGFNTMSITLLIRLVFFFVIENFEIPTAMLITFNLILTGGIINIFFIGILIFLIFSEE